MDQSWVGPKVGELECAGPEGGCGGCEGTCFSLGYGLGGAIDATYKFIRFGSIHPAKQISERQTSYTSSLGVPLEVSGPVCLDKPSMADVDPQRSVVVLAQACSVLAFPRENIRAPFRTFGWHGSGAFLELGVGQRQHSDLRENEQRQDHHG